MSTGIARAALSAMLLWPAACVERFVRIETQPPSADVFIDGRYAGKSPVEHAFKDYGTLRVDCFACDVQADLYASSTAFVKLERPWYQVFPIELCAELFDPWTHVDRHEVHLDLDRVRPDAAATLDLKEAAERLRREIR